MADKPSPEWSTDEAVARSLLATLGWADAPLSPLGVGWDNTLYRVDAPSGPHVLRLPHREVAVALLRNEQRWLRHLAPCLPLPVPTPLHAGSPTDSFPSPWSLLPWLDGAPALTSPYAPRPLAEALATFLRALHRPAPPDAPINPHRGQPLAVRRPRLVAARDLLGDRVLDTFDAIAAGPGWEAPPVWVHGDTHPGNLLVHQGHLHAVIDWGDVCQGDPASDLSTAWMLFDAPDREHFFAVYGADDALVERARGWALGIGGSLAASSDDTPVFQAMAWRTIERAMR